MAKGYGHSDMSAAGRIFAIPALPTGGLSMTDACCLTVEGIKMVYYAVFTVYIP